MLSLLQAGRPTWNLVGYNNVLLRAHNEMRGNGCDECQHTWIIGSPEDVISITVHYANDSSIVAKNTRITVRVPAEPFSGEEYLTANVAADETKSLDGTATIDARSSPIVLVPLDAVWHPNGTNEALALPDNQTIQDVLSPNGVLIGDVHAGSAFRSELTLRFRCAAVGARAARLNLAQAEAAFSGRDTPKRETLKQVLKTEFEPGKGKLDHDKPLSPLTWIETIPAVREDDVVYFFITYFNPSTSVKHNVNVHVAPDEHAANNVRITVRAGEEVMTTSIVRLEFEAGTLPLRLVAAKELRPDWFVTLDDVFASMSDVQVDPDDAILIGDVPPRTSILVAANYVVTPDVVTREDRAQIATAEREYLGTPTAPYPETALTNDVDPTIIAVARLGDKQWSDHCDNLKPGDVFEFQVRYAITGDVPAHDLRAHLRIDPTEAGRMATVELIARNAKPAVGSVRLSCLRSCDSLDIESLGATWDYGGTEASQPIDVQAITTSGLLLGDRLPQDQESIVLFYRVIAARPDR
jgi:hypothetical protein